MLSCCLPSVPGKCNAAENLLSYVSSPILTGNSTIVLTVALTAEYLTHGGNHAWVLILQEVLLCYSFMSATVPCIRSFLGAFFSPFQTLPGFGTSFKTTTVNSIALRSMDKKVAPKTDEVPLRTDVAEYGVDIGHGPRRRTEDGDSVVSDGSERMIIRGNTEIQVRNE